MPFDFEYPRKGDVVQYRPNDTVPDPQSGYDAGLIFVNGTRIVAGGDLKLLAREGLLRVVFFAFLRGEWIIRW